MTYRLAPYTEVMRGDWDRFAEAKGTVFHTIGFRNILLQSFGYRSGYHAVLDEQNRVCGLLPLIVGRNLSLKKVGLSLPFANYTDICAADEDVRRFALESMKRLRAELGLGYVELRLQEQRLPEELASQWSINENNYTFVLPLAGEEEQILALSSGSNRNHVRKVYKNNWFEVSFDQGHLPAFYQVYVRRMKQLGSPAPDIAFFKRFFELLPEQATLLTVLDRETSIVAGGMVLLASPSNGTLYYPYGANLTEYNNKYLNNFMYWEAVRFGMRCGLQQLDLGRSPAGSGTYTFKEKFGAKPVQLQYLVYDGGSGGQGAPDKDSLSFFVELWKKMPSLITNPVGRVLMKYLMP
ncbi:GNAT family N-acetyltransferase [Paenibacillus koleovorans]|uniref:GNAT family N-acetyltransferase n=1 Tax=Paenibacillus koleovorans TaxID=121608 RepID=UPI000FDA775E|nr:GNAT family N-acetyltransferase [Paenibacillus koleovorans]